MANLVARSAIVFSLPAKNLRGADNRPPPGRARVKENILYCFFEIEHLSFGIFSPDCQKIFSLYDLWLVRHDLVLEVTSDQSLTSYPRHSFDTNTLKLAEYNRTVQIVYLGVFISLTSDQVSFVPAHYKSMGKIKYRRFG